MALTISGFTITGNLNAVHIIPPPPPEFYLWGFGRNNNGRLGLGDLTDRSSPAQIGSLTTWLSIAGGEHHVLSTKTDGTMWSWGGNSYGQLGVGDTTNRSSPVQIGALTTWLNIAAGFYHSMAIKTDGTMWAWGDNSYGKLGLGNAGSGTHRSSPVQIGDLTTWATVDAANGSWTAAIKTDGTMWTWGRNDTFGALGLGNVTNQSSPVQMGSLTNWLRVSGGGFHGISIKTDGTMWSWGRNAYGTLGVGDLTDRSSPVQVGALTTWSSIAAGSHHALAVKTDGTMWSWGDNGGLGAGRLGLGDQDRRSSPVQIGALTTWLRVSAGRYHSAAIKTDGTMWSWGRNAYGELGDNTTTGRSSPVQIGALTAWSSISAAGRFSLAISQQ